MCYTYYFRLSNFCLFLTSGHSLDTMTFASKSYHTWQFPTLRGGAPSPQPPPILWQICISFKNQTSVTCHFGWPKPPPMISVTCHFGWDDFVRWYMYHIFIFQNITFYPQSENLKVRCFLQAKSYRTFQVSTSGGEFPSPSAPSLPWWICIITFKTISGVKSPIIYLF